jgi:signal transduction histidine kinase
MGGEGCMAPPAGAGQSGVDDRCCAATRVIIVVHTWTLAQRLRVALGVFALLLALSVTAVVIALARADGAVARQTDRLLPARIAASELIASLVDQETGLRGFALTHDESYLQPYKDGRTKEVRVRRQLEGLVKAGDPARLDLLTLDARITAWHQEYAELRLLDVRRGSGRTTITFGRDLFGQIRVSSAVLDRELAKEAHAAQTDVDQDRSTVLVVLAITALTVALAMLGLQRALQRSVLAPMKELGRQVEVVSRGAHDLPIRPSGPPDLQAVGEGVESMRLELLSVLEQVEQSRQLVEKRALDLARSNDDLEQFAYVASHDLQEPLRKVASFCQLLEQRYGGELDERGKQYIAFAVDGATRMQRLITDLLTFSRVGRTSEGFVDVDLQAETARAWDALEDRVNSSGATLTFTGTLQHVHGDASLIQLLLGNLLGNSLKYSRDDRLPVIRVSTTTEGDLVRVDVEDNGIGIEPEYAAKVFVIFQRLHARDQYEGTGIGLSLCKKVVEFHGGTIELRPTQLEGTCVSFTLPRQEIPS